MESQRRLCSQDFRERAGRAGDRKCTTETREKELYDTENPTDCVRPGSQTLSQSVETTQKESVGKQPPWGRHLPTLLPLNLFKLARSVRQRLWSHDLILKSWKTGERQKK